MREVRKNMKKNMFRKELVLGIIILFVGIAVQPGIIADNVIESDKSEMVEITIQICEIDGVYDYDVLLSQEQAEELENLISRTKNKLDDAKTSGETSIIFSDTVASLFEIGILSESMDIEDIQCLVNGEKQNSEVVKKLEEWFNRNQGNIGTEDNYLCLISGDSTGTCFQGPIGLISMIVFGYLLKNDMIFTFLLSIWNNFPLSFGYKIGLGGLGISGTFFAQGWVHTIGLNGIKNWDDTFIGSLPLLPVLGWDLFFTGILGFTGINIGSLENNKHFYIGTALWTRMT